MFIPLFKPDICVICDESKLDDACCVSAPHLIIEIKVRILNKKPNLGFICTDLKPQSL